MAQEEAPKDPTFRNYTAEQASDYAAGRLGYTDALYNFILNYHRSTNGQTKCVLDVGCGPGTATQKLAQYFEIAYGVDPGESMIKAATDRGGKTCNSTPTPIIYKLGAAEEIDKIDDIPHSSVDMVTAASAAHWFDMPRFWAAAAKVLKPGGTVAIWLIFRHPGSFNNNAKLRSIFNDFRDSLTSYSTPSSHLTQTGYIDLPMPWDNPSLLSLYDYNASPRYVLTAEDGFVPYAEKKDSSNVAVEPIEKQLERLEKLVGTLGSVNRWQKENPELVGTEKDLVQILINRVREAMQEIEEPFDLTSLAKMATALILIKRN